ncbi:carotenoid oxygenase family protein [Streptomyces sp. NPDC047002]|uniref:carotenoid oxygenase family protein n=1 Tax=Streptomyces sp. NPDC047002 TaxID=3155475 RepID=UPI0034551ACE
MERWRAMGTRRSNTLSHLWTSAYIPIAEEAAAGGLPVLGTLPRELDGLFAVVGPNALGAYDPAQDHQFAGDAMLHGLRLGDGHAPWYRNRWLRTDRVTAALGELPTPGPRHGLSDNANAGLVEHAGRLLALGDGGVLPHQIGPDLRTVARIDFDGAVPDGLCSRPVTDPLTGELHALAHRTGQEHVTYLVIDPADRVVKSERLGVKGSPLMHGLGLTDRHVILFDLPVVYSERAAAGGSRVPYAWDSGHGARLGVLPRDGGDAEVLWTEVDPCFVFHPVNAYESGRRIVVDVIRHERAFDLDPLHPGESRPSLWRWIVDRSAGRVAEEQLSDGPEEFPAIDDRYLGGPHRYVWTVGMDEGVGAALGGPRLLRHDLTTGRLDTHSFAPREQAGVPVFVPRTACADEGDGWLLTLVHDDTTDRSALHVVDNADFTGPPAAVVPLPARVPHGLGAAWTATA